MYLKWVVRWRPRVRSRRDLARAKLGGLGTPRGGVVVSGFLELLCGLVSVHREQLGPHEAGHTIRRPQLPSQK